MGLTPGLTGSSGLSGEPKALASGQASWSVDSLGPTASAVGSVSISGGCSLVVIGKVASSEFSLRAPGVAVARSGWFDFAGSMVGRPSRACAVFVCGCRSEGGSAREPTDAAVEVPNSGDPTLTGLITTLFSVGVLTNSVRSNEGGCDYQGNAQRLDQGSSLVLVVKHLHPVDWEQTSSDLRVVAHPLDRSVR